MVIRRIREHVTTHNWFAVGIDFLIVVAGIVIGTQVNNWNQARIERNQGKEYRERLIAELRSNEARDKERKHYWDRVRRHAESALSGLETPSSDGRQLVIDAYQASQILTAQSKRSTYDELISTGRIEHVGDAKLRNEIAGYYDAIQTYGVIFSAVPAYRELLRNRMPSAAQQAVRRQCPEIYYASQDGSPLARLPSRCSFDLDSSIAAPAVLAVRQTPGMIEHLNRLIADLEVKLALLDAMAAHSRRLRARLEKVEVVSS